MKQLESLGIAAVVLCAALAGCVTGEPLESASTVGASALTPSELHRQYNHGIMQGEPDFELDLYVDEQTKWSPYEGHSVSGFGFTTDPSVPATVPGPEIRVKQGDKVRVRLHDTAGLQPHTIHWHGLSVPWAMDGVPFLTQDVAANDEVGVYTYEFVAYEPGTYWYHCHVEAPAHVDLGMFGAFIVEPADPADDPPFDREATLLLHEVDSAYTAAMAAAFEGNPDPVMNRRANPLDEASGVLQMTRIPTEVAGFMVEGVTGVDLFVQGPRSYYPAESITYRPKYDTFMINGKSYPDTEPVFINQDETLRVRLINAGQLLHTMHLHGHKFLVTHKDGWLLPAPYYADTLAIAPAERYDIYVEGYNPGIWDFHDHGGGYDMGGYASNKYAFPGGINTMLVYEDFGPAQLNKPAAGAKAGDFAVFAPSYAGR